MRKRWILNLFLLFSSVLLSLLIGEGIFRYVIKIPVPIYPPVTWHYPELYQQNDAYGYSLKPSMTTTYWYPQNNPRELTVHSNSYGFRSNRELSKTSDKIEILVLGDSFVFGEGVEEDERFTNILERLQPNWQVDNLGMTGWGPDLMLMALEKVGLSVNPDAVVLCIYTHDFRRIRPYYAGIGFKIPRYKLKSGKLTRTSYPKQPVREKLYLVQAIRNAYWTYTNATYSLMEVILNRFIELSSVCQFKPILIFLPGRGDTKIDKERRFWLSDYAQRKAISFLDLTDTIHSKKRNEVFITNNPHLNPTGHHLVALELRQFLAREINQ